MGFLVVMQTWTKESSLERSAVEEIKTGQAANLWFLVYAY
jgi:hypothetical protein